MVTSHGNFSHLLLDQEIVQAFLLRELISETNTLVVDPETDHDLTGLTNQSQTFVLSVTAVFRTFGNLLEGRSQLVVVVTDVLGLAPYGLPGLVKLTDLFLDDLELVHQVSFIHALRGMLVLRQDQTEM